MPDTIRVLTDKGITQFASYLNELRAGSNTPPPFDLLTDPETSSEVELQADIERHIFANRYELGVYLSNVLSAFDDRTVSRNYTLWTWLALYYFDQTCPVLKEGRRSPGEDARHLLPDVYNWRNYYRHLVREPWLAVRINGDIVRPLLAGDLYQRGDLIEQCSSRQTIISNPVIMDAVRKLYIDPKTGRLRRGTARKIGGSPRRLSAVLQQLGLTFDLRASNASDVVSLLPREFDQWKPT
jgi:hypothetical protein